MGNAQAALTRFGSMKPADEDTEQDPDEVPDNWNEGHFAVLEGQWGGRLKIKSEDDWMISAIRTSPTQMILPEEVVPLFFATTCERQELQIKHEGHSSDMFPAVKGTEGPTGNIVLSAGRPGIVLGVRPRVFHRTHDGTYRAKHKEKVAVSRIMVSELKMRTFRFRGCGNEPTDIFPVANVNMHCREAKMSRGYISITDGGGASVILQPNDTDLHEHVRKRFIDLQTQRMPNDVPASG